MGKEYIIKNALKSFFSKVEKGFKMHRGYFSTLSILFIAWKIQHSTGKRTETVQASICIEIFSLFVVILHFLPSSNFQKQQRLTTLQMSQCSQVRVYIISNILTCTWTLLMQPRTWLGWRKNRLLILLITKQKRNFSFWDICIVWDMYSYHARLTLSGNSPCIIFPYINISKCIIYTVYFGHLINFVLMWLWLPSNMLEVINCYNQI